MLHHTNNQTTPPTLRTSLLTLNSSIFVKSTAAQPYLALLDSIHCSTPSLIGRSTPLTSSELESVTVTLRWYFTSSDLPDLGFTDGSTYPLPPSEVKDLKKTLLDVEGGTRPDFKVTHSIKWPTTNSQIKDGGRIFTIKRLTDSATSDMEIEEESESEESESEEEEVVIGKEEEVRNVTGYFTFLGLQSKTNRDVIDFHYRFKIPSQYRKYISKKLNLQSSSLNPDTIDVTPTIPTKETTKDNTQKRRQDASSFLSSVRQKLGATAYAKVTTLLKGYAAKSIKVEELKGRMVEVVGKEMGKEFGGFLPKKYRD
ncbi:hypothetical protein TL16_g12409 [Triparma laevis f. inornata]|uniref:Uncharacterized protein n=1 Tax=Triparma laevis f. inornata TaxID=1714386 RepID=A0A9W7BTV0_9STRA|nr:hypothetical protein TL16_g12409 [Triparma laevis f. inornata]